MLPLTRFWCAAAAEQVQASTADAALQPVPDGYTPQPHRPPVLHTAGTMRVQCSWLGPATGMHGQQLDSSSTSSLQLAASHVAVLPASPHMGVTAQLAAANGQGSAQLGGAGQVASGQWSAQQGTVLQLVNGQGGHPGSIVASGVLSATVGVAGSDIEQGPALMPQPPKRRQKLTCQDGLVEGHVGKVC